MSRYDNCLMGGNVVLLISLIGICCVKVDRFSFMVCEVCERLVM